jgi:dTDP-4-amino-4,6-dideoxygalactose transaminase
MTPRGRLDIGWRDLAAAAAACLLSRSRATLERRVEQAWSRDEDALVCLSVRSGLDLLLTALRYPKGSEVLVSAVTIRDMVRIIEDHGLVPVPVDVDTQTLGVKMESLRRALSPKTRAVLVAHLFGSRTSLEAVGAFAREHGLLLIEDCAQAFTGLDYRGDPASDVALFSFGPIKTATALGGAVLAFRDRELLARTRGQQEAFEAQPRREFAQRVLRFAVVKALLYRVPFTLFCAACRLAGRSPDEVISRSARGFSGPDFFGSIRRRPSPPLLATLARRLRRFDPERIVRRTRTAEAARARLKALAVPGAQAPSHSYWSFPVLSSAPDELLRHLRQHGFDATRGAWSLYAVPAAAARPEQTAPEAHDAMRRVVYLPVYPQVPEAELVRLLAVADDFERSRSRQASAA